MNREAWLVFVALVAAIGVGFLVVTTKEKAAALEKAQAEAVRASAEFEAQKLRAKQMQELLGQEKARADGLAREMAQATNTQHRLESEMRSALQSRDVAVSELQGKLMVTIVDRVLFDSGEAQLKPDGTKVLEQVAGVLAGFTNRQVQVFGHTDNKPIRLKFASNWELSAARAVAAVRYLSERAGVDARRLSAVGCGEFQPLADNSTAEGRAKNRRIALVVLPEQFAATDVTPAEAAAAGSTNVPPVVTNTVPVVPTITLPARETSDTVGEVKAAVANAPKAEVSVPREPVPALGIGTDTGTGTGTNLPPMERAGRSTNAPTAGAPLAKPAPGEVKEEPLP